jgi:S1-C subfamily serine protease
VEGVYVDEVTENRSAAEAGIKAGDVITAINNVSVNSVTELQVQVSMYRPNDQVDLTVIRDKKMQQFKVTLRNIEGTTQILLGDNSNAVFGAIFEEISNRDRQSLRIRSGIKVKDVGEGKFKELGMRNGFIITSVNDKPVNSAKDFQTIIDASKGEILIRGIYPNGQVAIYGFNK